MKNKRAEVKFTLYDVLNKNVGFSRDVNDNRIIDQAYNVLNRYFQQTYSVDLINNFRSNFTLNNQFSYVVNTGRAPGFNNRVPLWNLSLAKNFMKNKRAELKFTLYDVLNKNVGFSRDVNDNRIVDQAYNVLNRYFLLGFTYSLNKSGLNRGPGPVLRRIGG